MKKLTLLFSALAGIVLATSAYAAAPGELWIYCGGLPGCPSGFQERFTGVLVLLLTILPDYVDALGVLFIMIGGAYILLSTGNSERVTKGKNAVIWAVVGIFIAHSAETLVGFVTSEVNSRVAATDLFISIILTAISSITDLFYIALLGVAIYSGMRMVLSLGKEEEFSKARDGLFWAAVGAIIINLSERIADAFKTL
jgi:hypothetical protein